MHYTIQRMVREERPDYSNINTYLDEHCPRPQMTEQQKDRETNGGLEKSDYDRHDRRDKFRGDRDRDRPDTKYQFNFRNDRPANARPFTGQDRPFINNNLKKEEHNPNNNTYSNRPTTNRGERKQESNNPPAGRPRFFNANR